MSRCRAKTLLILSVFIFDFGFNSFAAKKDEKSPVTDLSIKFDTASPKQFREAEQILGEIRGNFTSIFKKEVKLPSIDIEFVPHIVAEENTTEPKYTSDGRLQGLTKPTEAGYSILISNERTSTWGRILAHELAHVVLQEAFGVHRNQWLSEGMAEVLACKSFPSEVIRSYNRQEKKKFVAAELVPYIEGYWFCRRHFEESCFARFYESEAKNSVDSMSELESRWQQFKLDENEANHPPLKK